MPDFTQTITAEAEVHIEVFCGQCGGGVCGECDIRYSKQRGEPQLVVNCKSCIKSFESQIKELEEKVDSLERENYQLEKQVKS